MEELFLYFIFAAAGITAFLVIGRKFRLGSPPGEREHSVHRWAAANGYRLLAVERCLSLPNFLSTTPMTMAETAYHVTVEDRDGNRREGWVRWKWVSGEEPEVRWDE
jgi:hypothetical protein